MPTPLNSLGYAVLSDSLRRKVFGDLDLPSDDPYKVNTVMDEMEKFGVKFPIKNPPSFSQLPEDFNIPPLNGLTISDHFRNISRELMGEYEERLKGFMKLPIPSPPPPSVVQECVGWVKYEWLPKGKWGVKRVNKIEEDIAIFDCETFVKGSDFGHPILATVVTSKAYYVWMHECFVDPTLDYQPQLVSLGRGGMVLIAHNVAFDRQRTLEAYSLNDTNQWFDTMSAHVNVSGLGSEQRFWFTDPKNRSVSRAPAWTDRGCLNNLVDCYNFHCKPTVMLEKSDKETRNVFVVAESMSEMVSGGDELVQYALRDVKYTYELYSILAWKYLEANPSLTTLCGHFSISSAILPVVDNWSEWVEGCEEKWEEAIHKQNELLNEIAKEVYEDWKKGELEVESDPWLSQLDWSFSSSVTSTGKPRSKWYGIPLWVKKVSEVDPKTREVTFTGISTKNLLSHILLRLKWGESPLIYVRERGWTYFDKEKGEMTQVPHPKNEGSNVGGVLSKDFLPEFETGVLNSDLPQANELIKLAINVAYWTSVRSRVKAQLVQKIPNPQVEGEFNLIVPSAVPHNTSTNRAGENLWLTVPDPKYDKIGSEIKTRVQAPPGYVFVQSDFDAQEAVIASIFADSYHKIAGSTQLSHSILAGTKEDGSDMHSMTAKTIGISRDVAKGCNYAMLYGCGAKTLANTIRRGNKSISMETATSMGRLLIKAKKGRRSDKDQYLMVEGSDSYAYNVMAKIANSTVPTNPLSGTKMSTAFRPFVVGTDFWTMRNNWCIQSTGSAMLHAFVTAMAYLGKTYNLNSKFCMAVHDSVLYMCPESQALEVAKMFQVAHVWCWSWLRYNFDIYEMPTANAWLSSVEVDRIFRKSAHSSTLTVSQDVKESDGKSYTMVDLVKLF
jgi:DNA polymerase gamma 1